MAENDLLKFMRQVSSGLTDEYERIRMRSLEDPGTAGDQGEENWAVLLREWLPATYHVVTKGRILGHDGRASPQVDVLVLSPAYPKYLLSKKLYLAAGVLAAFECKITLEAAHITDAIETAIAIRDLLPARVGTPYKELFSPIAFGLLAHSHSWKGEKSTPIENIENKLVSEDSRLVQHPRQMLDVLCVADLACWSTGRTTFIGPQQVPNWALMAPIYGPQGSATSAYMQHSETLGEPSADNDGATSLTPIGALLTALLGRFAWEDYALRDLSRYFLQANVGGGGQGQQRLWSASIYSDKIRDRVAAGMLSNGVFWDEWAVGFFC